MTFAIRRLISAGFVLSILAVPVLGQPAAETPPHRAEPAKEAAREPAKLPPEQTTHHVLELPGRTLKFAATAGAIRLSDDDNEPVADVAYIAYQLDGADRRSRPVTFVFNGGPGMASGWLQAGAVGPWRIPIGGANGVPSGAPDPQPNADTWLDFTDLVFVDPPGTGYSRIVAKADAARRRLWSVNGDIDALAETIRRWLDRSDRIVSPKYILGESYGGFRGPRLARRLQEHEGVGVSGLVLLSPLLDTHDESGFADALSWVDLLPTEVAVPTPASTRLAWRAMRTAPSADTTG